MLLPVVRSYLKLYTSMPIDKLALYMDDTTVDELESNLLCFKHKMMNLVWSKGTSGLNGDFKTESEVIFFSASTQVKVWLWAWACHHLTLIRIQITRSF